MLPSPNWVQRAQKPFKDTANLRIEVYGGIGYAEKARPGNFEAMRDFREVALAFATVARRRAAIRSRALPPRSGSFQRFHQGKNTRWKRYAARADRPHRCPSPPLQHSWSSIDDCERVTGALRSIVS